MSSSACLFTRVDASGLSHDPESLDLLLRLLCDILTDGMQRKS